MGFAVMRNNWIITGANPITSMANLLCQANRAILLKDSRMLCLTKCCQIILTLKSFKMFFLHFIILFETKSYLTSIEDKNWTLDEKSN